ncbi:alpha/beta hydrolase [Amycolatopsis sp. GM8]|uniref:alpha/beta hydrolase n=1 Tax=Amycolatopsis sp. GM8 TaxID=2896530 RepID=UPI001F1DD388|nr:alpha/beta fold hydrolase [Amycolatopsis sp. GM8]
MGTVSRRKALSLLAVAVLGFLGVPVFTAGSAAATPGPVCSEVTVPVRIQTVVPPLLPTPGQISGTLCRPADPGPKAQTIQLLLHGGAYNRSYWMFPYDPATYNYVDNAVGNGYTTLAIDRVGYGGSTHPLSALVTEPTTADTVHQVVQYIRDGGLGRNFAHVALVGHSMGSIAAIQEAGIYHDVDGIVITGIVHNQGAGLVQTVASMGPAILNPKFAGSGLDPGYLAVNSGARESLFYVPSNTDPGAVAADEATGDTFPAVEATGYVQEVNRVPLLWQAPNVIVPVLVLEGDHDILGCGGALDCGNTSAVVASEQSAYVNSPSVSVQVIPNAGHDLNLQKCAPEVYGTISSWIDQHI